MLLSPFKHTESFAYISESSYFILVIPWIENKDLIYGFYDKSWHHISKFQFANKKSLATSNCKSVHIFLKYWMIIAIYVKNRYRCVSWYAKYHYAIFLMFIFEREKETECKQGEGAVSKKPDCRAQTHKLTNRKIMTWTGLMLNWLSQGTPYYAILTFVFKIPKGSLGIEMLVGSKLLVF